MSLLARIKAWAARLKRDIVALWIAARSRRTPMAARILAAAVAAYALSPIDLIPDFIPILGYLDDAVLVPLGIAICIRLIPDALMSQFRIEAGQLLDRPRSLFAAIAIVMIWVIAAGIVLAFVTGAFQA